MRQITQGLSRREQRAMAGGGIVGITDATERSPPRSEKDGAEPMSRDTLNDTALDTVSGGLPTSLIGNSTIVKPHIPRDHDLLTPDQIKKVLALGGGIVPPIPRSGF